MATRDEILLEWKPAPGAAQYRVLLRDDTTGQFPAKPVMVEPRCALARSLIDAAHAYRWRVEWRAAPNAAWAEWIGYQPLLVPPVDERLATELTWPAAASDPLHYRIVIRDETSGQIVTKQVLTSCRYVADWTRLDPLRVYRYRVQCGQGDTWVEHTRYAPLAPPVHLLVAARDRAAPAPTAVDSAERLLILFTIDTEINLRLMREPDPARGFEHQIACIHDGRPYGVALMMDLLEQNGMRGTFFVDVLMEHTFGQAALEQTIELIASRGHDIQLHLHPSPHLWFAPDPALRELLLSTRGDDPAPFRAALAHAVELFERRVGRRPVAFRNGSYHLCEAFLPVLAEFGIRVDSSLYAFKNCRVPAWMRGRTQPFRAGGLLEVPVNWMILRKPGTSLARQYAIKKTEVAAQTAALALAQWPETAPRTLVYMAHSYTLLEEWRPDEQRLRDAWNARLRNICPPAAYRSMYLAPDTPTAFCDGPDQERILALARALAALAAIPGARSATFAELADRYTAAFDHPARTVDPVAVWHHSARRASVAGVRRYSRSWLAALEAHAAAQPAQA